METSSAGRRTPAIAFLALMLPFGISSGYASVTLSFQLTQHGMAAGAVAGIVALSIWPQTWKWLWAPIVDTTLGFKRWHVIGAVAVAAALLGLSIVPARASSAVLLGGLVVLSSVASTVVSMSAEALMAVAIEDRRRGIASGWAIGGNLGGNGLGGGLALWLSQHVANPWAPGAAVAIICLLCVAALPLVHPAHPTESRPAVLKGIIDVVRALWSLSVSRAGLLVIVLMLMPIGSGGAQNLWAAVAGDWRANADVVALVNGVLGGIASLIGGVIGGKLCDHLDRKTAYCLYGVALCGVVVLMALLPRTPGVFVAMTLGYAVVLGACYAAYTAVVLEVIGTAAAATKFQLLSAVSNVPIALIVGWDGWLHDWRGANGMLFGEAAIGVAGILLFMAFARGTRGLQLPFRPAAAAPGPRPRDI